MAEGGNVASNNQCVALCSKEQTGATVQQKSFYGQCLPVPEELFSTTYSMERIVTLVGALKLATDKEIEGGSRLLGKDCKYSLVFTTYKRPFFAVTTCPTFLKHPLIDEKSKIVLIVKDLESEPDHNATIQHYENLLRIKNVEYKITVIPLSQLYKDYDTPESRRKFVKTYDKILVDEDLTKVNDFLEPVRNWRGAVPIDMTRDALNKHIRYMSHEMWKVPLDLVGTHYLQIGKHNMSKELIAENIINVMRNLGKWENGCYTNVHKIHLVNAVACIPIYVSSAKPVDGVPGGTTNQEEFTGEQSDKAAEVLEVVDIKAAAKLVQKHPSTLLVCDDLSSNDEKVDGEPLPKRARVATEAGGSQAAPKVPESPKPVKTQNAPAADAQLLIAPDHMRDIMLLLLPEFDEDTPNNNHKY